MNRETVLRVVFAAAVLVAPLCPVFAVDTDPAEPEAFGDDAAAADQLERLFHGAASAPTPEPVDSEVLVTVKLRNAGALSAERLEVERRFVRQGTHHIEGYVSLSSVRDLSTDPAVQSVLLRAKRDPGGLVAPGVRRIGANALHRQGLTGENVTVGVIDGGFRVSDPELAGHVAAYRSFGPPGDADHGTAVASVIADTAPGAELHVAAVGESTTATEYRAAVTWLRDSDTDIIVDAGSYFGHAGGDTGALSAVARNASEEVLFVTSAGNYGQRHWTGIHEPDDRRWVAFDSDTEGNTLAGGNVLSGRIRASLQWTPQGSTPADGNPTDAMTSRNATADATRNRNETTGGDTTAPVATPAASTGGYELHLFRRGVGGQQVVARASADGNESAAYLDATVPRGQYYLAIEGVNVSTPHRLELFATRDLTHGAAEGSLAVPASAPGVLAVGAYDHEADAVAAFSSRGPVGNRTGVGLVAPDAVAAPGTGATGGTSFAAPYVAGSAALVAGRYPNATADELRGVLAHAATDIGPPGPDPASGAGLLDAQEALAVADHRFTPTSRHAAASPGTNTTAVTTESVGTNRTAAPTPTPATPTRAARAD